MKKIKVGTIEIEIATTIEDLPAKRYVVWKNYFIQDETGVPIPTLREVFTKFTKEFDRDSKSGMFKALYDYVFKLGQMEKNTESSHMMFALLCFLPDEREDEKKLVNTDENFLKEKMEILYGQGITQGQIQEANVNFYQGLIAH